MARDLPVVSANPDTLVAVLTDAIGKGRTWLWGQGRLSIVFAQKYHDPLAVARQVSAALGL
jgi:hypothetical protein